MLARTMRAVVALVAVALLSGCGVNVEFSPDGKKLVVSGGEKGLVLMNADGSGRQLLPNTKEAAFARWSPDGQYILYEQPDWMGNRSKVFLYDLRTRSARAFTGYLSAPYTFSDDSRQVVAWDKGKACLVWLDVPSGERLLEVPCPATPTDVRLHWLPDRYGVAFMGQSEKEGIDVYTVEAGKVYRISTTGDVIGLGLSPDGKQLLWARQAGHDANATVTTFAYDLDARTVQKLPLQVLVRDLARITLPRGAKTFARAEFSSDGKSVALIVTGGEEGKEVSGYQKVFVLPLVGGHGREVFSAVPGKRHHELVISVAWSPNAEQMAFLTLWGEKHKQPEENRWRLRVTRPDGSQRRMVDL
ncbi:MAG: TolB family protein [Armatimonadota bacterium]